jgi:hypothetical protein
MNYDVTRVLEATFYYLKAENIAYIDYNSERDPVRYNANTSPWYQFTVYTPAVRECIIRDRLHPHVQSV